MRPLSRNHTFWLAGIALLVVMAASGAPSPLYVVYQQKMDFSSTVLTEIFAIYALALLTTLLTVGSLSDFVGRRPVLLAALALEVVSLALFLPADSVGWLLLARTVQGVATGAAIGALGATLVDTQPAGSQIGSLINSVAPGLGLAFGALGAGALVQFAPAPTTVVFVVLMILVGLCAVGVLVMPETATHQPGAVASLRPRIHVHREVRGVFLAALPAFVASWAVGGLYLSLGGSVADAVFGLHNHLVSGVVIAAMTGTGAVASILLRAQSPARTMVIGTSVLAVGLAGTVLAISETSTPVFFLGTVVAGFGFGASFLGGLRSVLSRVAADDRAATLAAILTVSYLAFSVPAVVAGITATHIGLRDTALWYGAAVIVVSLLALAAQAAQRRRTQPEAVPPRVGLAHRSL
ncbi:MFS transporter [Jatrophihabitans sp. DSM 45814]